MMMIQDIIITIAFILAIFFVAKIIYSSVGDKKNCSSGCGKCSESKSSLIDSEKNVHNA